jgi:hypothetical protein
MYCCFCGVVLQTPSVGSAGAALSGIKGQRKRGRWGIKQKVEIGNKQWAKGEICDQ